MICRMTVHAPFAVTLSSDVPCEGQEPVVTPRRRNRRYQKTHYSEVSNKFWFWRVFVEALDEFQNYFIEWKKTCASFRAAKTPFGSTILLLQTACAITVIRKRVKMSQNGPNCRIYAGISPGFCVSVKAIRSIFLSFGS